MKKFGRLNLRVEKLRCILLIFSIAFLYLIAPISLKTSASEAQSDTGQKAGFVSRIFNLASTSHEEEEEKKETNQQEEENETTTPPQNPLQGASLNVNVNSQLGGQQTAFPDGKSCVPVTISALNSSGASLQNEPLSVGKPDYVNLGGPTNTGSGIIHWCVSSSVPAQVTINIFLTNMPSVSQSFTLNFMQTFTISDISNNTTAFIGSPLFFTAQIQPSLVNGIISSTLRFSHFRCAGCGDSPDPLFPGVTQNMTAVNAVTTEVPLNCSTSGLCSAAISGAETSARNMANGQYSYTFRFVTSNDDIFQQTFQNTLTTAP